MKRRIQRFSRIRTPGLRPRCTAVHPRTGARCIKPQHDDRSHRWTPRRRVTKQRKHISFEVRRTAAAMVDDKKYRQRLLRDLRARKLRPSVEVMLWHQALGKPIEPKEHFGEVLLIDQLRGLTREQLCARAEAIAALLTKKETE